MLLVAADDRLVGIYQARKVILEDGADESLLNFRYSDPGHPYRETETWPLDIVETKLPLYKEGMHPLDNSGPVIAAINCSTTALFSVDHDYSDTHLGSYLHFVVKELKDQVPESGIVNGELVDRNHSTVSGRLLAVYAPAVLVDEAVQVASVM